MNTQFDEFLDELNSEEDVMNLLLAVNEKLRWSDEAYKEEFIADGMIREWRRWHKVYVDVINLLDKAANKLKLIL